MSKDTKAKKEAPKKDAKEDSKKKADAKVETSKKETKETKPKTEAPKKEVKAETPKKEVKAETPKKDAKTEVSPKEDKAAKVEPKKEKPEEAVVKETKPAKEVKEEDKATPEKPAKAPKQPAPAKEEEKEEILPTFEEIKLFNKWTYKDLVVDDPGLQAYICLKPVIAPHTGGRYEHQRFKKAEMPIVERLVNKLMRTRKGTGKKERMINAVKISFEIINVKTGQNPLQVFIKALQNAAPREEVTRITYGGMAQLQSVDVAPMRRLDIALTNIVEGVYKKSFNNVLSAEEILANELIDAADNKPTSFSVSKMLEIERVALSAR